VLKNLCRGRWNVGVAAASSLASWPEQGAEMPASNFSLKKFILIIKKIIKKTKNKNLNIYNL
jgi:hypothetical protein